MRTTRGIDDHQTLIAPDAMLGMNNEIPLLERADLTKKILAAPTPRPWS